MTTLRRILTAANNPVIDDAIDAAAGALADATAAGASATASATSATSAATSASTAATKATEAATSATAAATSATGAASSATTATTKATEAASSATAAATSATSAASSATTATTQAATATTQATNASASATAAAASAGTLGTYATSADLAGRPAGTYRLTNFSGTVGGTVYSAEDVVATWSGSAVTAVASSVVTRRRASLAVYVDGVLGSDANDGLTQATPKATLAAAVALLRAGDVLRIARGSHFREVLSTSTALVRVESYGTGPKPIIDGARAIAASAWAPVSGYPNVYQATVVHAVATTGALPGGNHTHCHYQLWDVRSGSDHLGTPLTRVIPATASGASRTLATDLAAVAAAPGSFTVRATGSPDADPRYTNGLTSHVYYARLLDDANPASATGVSLEYAEQVRLLSLTGAGQLAYDLRLQRTANVTAAGSDGNKAGGLVRVDMRDVAVHGWVGGPVAWRGCDFRTRLPYSKAWAGGAYHAYVAQSITGTSSGAEFDDIYAEGFGIGLYSHGDASPLPPHKRVLGRRLRARSCTQLVTTDTTAEPWVVEEATGIECDSITSGNIVLRRLRFVSSAGGGGLDLHGAATIEDGVVVLLPLAGVFGQVARNAKAASENSAVVFDVTLTRTTVVGGVGANTTRRAQLRWALTDSVLDFDMEAVNATPYSGITGVRSYLREGTRTLAEMQARYAGIAATCLTPYLAQAYARTVIAADLAYASVTRTATYSGTPVGDGTAILTLNGATQAWGRYVRVVDAYGTGLHYEGRLVSTGTNQITVTPAPTSAFSAKVLHVGYFSRAIWSETPATGTISVDGTQITMTDATLYSVGEHVRVAGPLVAGRYRTEYGARRITAISGSVLTLDRACLWRTNTSLSASITAPTVEVRRGLTLRAKTSALAGVAIAVTPVEGGSAIAHDEVLNSGQLTNHTNRLASSGAVVSFGTIRHEHGYVDAGLAVAVGDAIVATSVAYAEDLAPRYVGEPAMTGRAWLERGHYLASLSMGYREWAL